MDKLIFRRQWGWKTLLGSVFTALDDQGNERYHVKTELWFRILVFIKGDDEPFLTIQPKSGLTLSARYAIRDRSGVVIGEIFPRFSFRYPACWEIRDTRADRVAATICQRWCFSGVKADIFLNGEQLGTFFQKGWSVEYIMDLSKDAEKKTDWQFALASAVFLCNYCNSNGDGS